MVAKLLLSVKMSNCKLKLCEAATHTKLSILGSFFLMYITAYHFHI